MLRRTWDAKRPRVLYVMLNPSIADANTDDPTIKSCIRLAKGFGHGSIEVVNLFAWRATDPNHLRIVGDPIGPRNDYHIEGALLRCDIAVCAWGANQFASQRGREVRSIIRANRPAVFCLGVTQSGAPKHPLYIKSGTLLETFGC